jgi:hypothetical protein
VNEFFENRMQKIIFNDATQRFERNKNYIKLGDIFKPNFEDIEFKNILIEALNG